VVNSVSEVGELVKAYNASDIKHKLIDEDDYIAKPRKSGYRSHHLIYSYYSDKNRIASEPMIQLPRRLRYSPDLR